MGKYTVVFSPAYTSVLAHRFLGNPSQRLSHHFRSLKIGFLCHQFTFYVYLVWPSQQQFYNKVNEITYINNLYNFV